MKTKFLIIVGAGATLSDASRSPMKKKPPLDKGFFKGASGSKHSEISTVRQYLSNTYDFDALTPNHDSLENVMAIIYTDIHNPQLEDKAVPAFRSLIRLFNRRIADTTNNLDPTNRSKLYRIICKALDDGISPSEICLVTFNQDIQIEKILNKINGTKRAAKYGNIFTFPACYTIKDARTSNPPPSEPRFPSTKTDLQGIRILKLHGSLNWFSRHKSQEVSKNAILNTTREFFITPRTKITPDLKFSKWNTFPLIVPPVTHKAGILHQALHPIWENSTKALKGAEEIVIFGYSCPAMDFESANLIRRTVHLNRQIKYFSIIDPNPYVFQRYVDLTGLKRIFWFRSAESFLKGYD
jgi:hypothetical protein